MFDLMRIEFCGESTEREVKAKWSEVERFIAILSVKGYNNSYS